LGVLLIWAKNDTWGQSTDFIAAFLWGMGLYQIGSGGFQGLMGIRTSLTG